MSIYAYSIRASTKNYSYEHIYTISRNISLKSSVSPPRRYRLYFQRQIPYEKYAECYADKDKYTRFYLSRHTKYSYGGKVFPIVHTYRRRWW